MKGTRSTSKQKGSTKRNTLSFKENNNAPVQDIEDHESTKKDERVSTPTKRSQSSTSISQPSTPMKRSQPCTSISEPTPSKLFCSSPSQSPRTSLSPTIPSNAVEITGYVGCVTSQKYNQTRTRQYFTVHLKIQPTQFAKVLISNHRSIKTVRQNFLNAFHDKVPIIVKDIVKGSEVYFFNAYSQVLQQNNPLEFSINDSDAEKIKDLNEEGIVVSVVGKIKFIGETIIQPFEKNGKRRTERLRKGMFSDGSKTIRISVWADLIDVLKEDYLIQLSEVNSRSFNEEICLTTTYATSVCFLTDALDVHFEIPKTIDQPSSTCHCCKSVYSIKIDQYTKCKFCQSRLSMSSGTGIASCVKCGRDFSVKKVSTSSDRIIKALVDFTDENGDLKSVTIFSDVLQKYFPTETFTDDVNLKSSLLELNGVDFLVNPSKNSVEEIRQCKH